LVAYSAKKQLFDVKKPSQTPSQEIIPTLAIFHVTEFVTISDHLISYICFTSVMVVFDL
jgi:hypothetical protein